MLVPNSLPPYSIEGPRPWNAVGHTQGGSSPSFKQPYKHAQHMFLKPGKLTTKINLHILLLKRLSPYSPTLPDPQKPPEEREGKKIILEQSEDIAGLERENTKL